MLTRICLIVFLSGLIAFGSAQQLPQQQEVLRCMRLANDYFMQKWLDGFAFRVHIGIGTFLFAVLGSMFIACLTVGYRSLKAALANPIVALRNE